MWGLRFPLHRFLKSTAAVAALEVKIVVFEAAIMIVDSRLKFNLQNRMSSDKI